MENINVELAHNLINTNLKLWEQNEQLREENHELEKCIEILADESRVVKENSKGINENKLDRFQRGLKNGKVFIYEAYDDNVRGIGKTTSIIYLSLKHNLPILVDLPSSRRYMHDICNSEGINIPKIYTVNESHDYGVIKHGSNILVDILGLKNYIDLSREYNILGGCVGVPESMGHLLVL